MRVLGIDPGIAITGIAVVDENKSKFQLVHAHAITTASHTPLPARLEMVYDELLMHVQKWKPDFASLESLFFNTNAKTALIVGQARGVVQLLLNQQKIAVTEYTPLQVKMAITGYGRADKPQIQQMVKTILSLPAILKPDDVADACAIALTHCFSYKMNSLKTNF